MRTKSSLSIPKSTYSKKMTTICVIFSLILLTLSFYFPTLVEAYPLAKEDSNIVQNITVEVFTERGKNLPLPVKRRMENSVSSIASELFIGKKIADIEQDRASYENILGEVFDKILVGYSVDKVKILEKANAKKVVINIKLLPWMQTIEDIRLETTVEGVPQNIKKFVARDLEGIENVFRASLFGLPTAASDWTNGILKREVEQFMEGHLPEFRADFSIVAGKKTEVKLIIYPRLPVVRTLDLFMRSKTILNLALLNERDFFLSELNTLLGLPVAFVKRHEEELTRDFAHTFDASSHFQMLELKTKLHFSGSENMHVYANIDTDKYRLRLEGFLDIQSGRREKGTSFRLHAGKKISHQDELFLETDIFPQEFSFQPSLGVERQLMHKWSGSFSYNLTEHVRKYELHHDFDRRFRLSYVYERPSDERASILRYRLHDFLSIETIRGKERKWIRLVGDF